MVVPVYQQSLSPVEACALRVCSRRLRRFELVLLHRRSVDPQALRALLEPCLHPEQRCRFVAVADSCLGSVSSYNRMLLQAWFYRLFAAWNYILIFQLDAWVFSEDLGDWLRRGHAYVGAPWIRAMGTDTPDTGVGNGGLSLRHVDSFIRVLEGPRYRWMPVYRWGELARRICLFEGYAGMTSPQRLRFFLARLSAFVRMSFGWNNTLSYFVTINLLEDHFFSFCVPFVARSFRIPGIEEAALFSLETNPRATFAWLEGRPPFGCHAWERYDRAFWLDAFPSEFEGCA